MTGALHKKCMMSGSPAVAAVYEAVNELMTRNSPPKLGGEPARTKSEQAGWFPCRYWQLREPPRPRLRSGTPPNLGGECPHSNSFTAPMTAQDFLCKAPSTCFIPCRFLDNVVFPLDL